MPLSRYQIRNEYSLADPELYKAADKDDPEALLEGVAMAGLVGVLRQLGDLAEFAAEIFHDLHEEVMVTAARGHSLMVRVQQLEAEFPTIEKAFLSQTNHSSFFYHPGLEWHPNIRMEQSLIARGDLPRFVMDSYEECRGPPRLFLLDKFDVAGAGACLKRYSDPSFFKVEPSSFGITSTDVQREKKVRKTKKKGSRWRNGETPDALPTSHAKLHQLFLEERNENGVSDPAGRVKLKRRLNGFPFSSKSGNSYMEKFLKSPSPDHKDVHDIPVDSSTYESYSETAKLSTVCPMEELDPRPISPSLSPPKEEIISELFVHKQNEFPGDTRDSATLQSDGYNISHFGIEAYNIPSTLQVEDSEKEIAVDGRKTDDSIDDYQSDDIASEIDNYMDALTTMESEMDTDSDFKIKNDLRYLNGRKEARVLDADDVQCQAHSSDSQSMGNSSLSDYGNSSSKKEISSFSYSDTHSTTAENTLSDGEVSRNVLPSIEIHETEIVDSSLDLQPPNEEHPWSHPPGSAVLDGLSTEAAKIPSQSSEVGDQTASLSPSDSDPSYRSTEAFTKEGAQIVTETDEVVRDPSLDISLVPSISKATEEIDYDSPQRLSGENQFMDGSGGGDKDTSEIVPDTSYLSVSSHSKDDLQPHVLAENQLGCELNDEDVNPDKNDGVPVINQDLNDDDGPPQINHENSSLLSTGDQPLDEMHAEFPNLSENVPSASKLSDSPSQLRDSLPVAGSAESLPVKEMFDEYRNSTADGLTDVAAEEKGNQSSVDSVPKSETEEDLYVPNSDDNRIGEQNPGIRFTDAQPLGQTYYLDADAGDTVSTVDDVSQSAGELPDNVTPKEDTPSESVEYLVLETNTEVVPIRSLEEQTSCSRQVNFDELSDRGDGSELSEAACNTNMMERDSTVEPLLLAGNHVDLDKVDTDSVNAAAENNAIDFDDGPSGDLRNSREVCLSGSEVEAKQLMTEEPCLSERPEESCATEGGQQIFSWQCSNSDSYQVVSDDQSESESQVVNNVSATYLLLEAEDNADATTATAVQLSFEENKLESFNTEEKVELVANQLDQPSVLEVNSEVAINQTQYQKCVDHVGPLSMCTSSNSVPVNLPNEPSETELSLQGSNNINTCGHPRYPSNSILSSFPLLPTASEILVDEMPPMPPLPPVQWRMTKSLHDFPSRDAQAVNKLLPQFALGDENSHPVSEQPIGEAVRLPSLVHHGGSKDDILPQEGIQHRGILPLSGSDGEMLQHSFQSEERENEKPKLISSSDLSPTDTASPYGLELSREIFMESLNQGVPETSLNEECESVENMVISDATRLPSTTEYEQSEQAMPVSAHAIELSNEKLIRPLNQVAPETSIKEMELGNSSAHLEENLGSYDRNPLSSKTQNEQPQHTISTSEATLAWPVGEENKPNGLWPMKLPRPRNPLIDAVAAHDKSKLRKVTDRVRPEKQEEDERDSLLEQIRTKSFNLKPAVVTRPSIPGPTTNLKVAAILEKAKTIRQAFAGSDEDEDDTWSD